MERGGFVYFVVREYGAENTRAGYRANRGIRIRMRLSVPGTTGHLRYTNCAGGPRFWLERANETRSNASVCGETEGCRAIPAKTEAASDGVKDVGAKIAGGATSNGHRARMVCRERLCASSIAMAADIMQWCLPLRRQQAGSVSSAACAPNIGMMNGNRKSASNELARRRRTLHYRKLRRPYAPPE